MACRRTRSTAVADNGASESDIEMSITTFLTHALPEDAFQFHISNEGRRGRSEQARFKKAGGKAGVPDRCILWRGKAYFLEAKSDKGTLTQSQKKTIPQIQTAGCPVAVVRSVEDVEAVLRCWGFPFRASLLGM